MKQYRIITLINLRCNISVSPFNENSNEITAESDNILEETHEKHHNETNCYKNDQSGVELFCSIIIRRTKSDEEKRYGNFLKF